MKRRFEQTAGGEQPGWRALPRLALQSACALIVLAFVGLGCGQPPGSSCQFDSDCAGENLCIDSLCAPQCIRDSDCDDPFAGCGRFTKPREERTVKVCMTDERKQNTGKNQTCSSNRECRESILDHEEAVCGADSRCFVPVTQTGILIRDRTKVQSVAQNGAEIIGVFLKNSSGEYIGSGFALEYRSGPAIEGQTFPALNRDLEAARAADSGQCLGDSVEGTVRLGGQSDSDDNSGALLVGFVNRDERRIQLSSEWKLVIAEWGGQCISESANNGGEPGKEAGDRFEVWYCEGRPSERLRAGRDCTTRLQQEDESLFTGWNELDLSSIQKPDQ